MPRFNKEKLQANIIELSESNNWYMAKLGWELDFIYRAPSAERCLCGHSPIIELCVLINIKNDNEAVVGNVCVKKFMDLCEPSQIFRSFNSIEKKCKEIIKCCCNKICVPEGLANRMGIWFSDLGDEDAQVNAISLITKISHGGDDAIKAIFKANHFIANFLDASDRGSRIVALSAILSLLQIKNKNTEIAIDMGVACDLCNFLSHDDGEIVLETLESLTHLLEKAGSRVSEIASSIQGCGGVDIINDLQEDDDETKKKVNI